MCTCIDIVWWVISGMVGVLGTLVSGREGKGREHTYTYTCGNVEVEILNLGTD